MLFRLGLFLGLAIGYVLGARAGRERYDQIQALARQLARTEPVQQLSDEVRTAASRAGDRLEARASETIAEIGERVGGDATSDGEPLGSPETIASQ